MDLIGIFSKHFRLSQYFVFFLFDEIIFLAIESEFLQQPLHLSEIRGEIIIRTLEEV